jgi:succinoglycan biosynthesis transport protein ExoP
MDLTEHLIALRQRWRLVLALTVAGLAAATALAVTAERVYESRVELFVATAQPADVTQAYQGSLFTQQRVTSYADLVTSPLVTDRVVRRLRLDADAQDLRERVTSTVPLDSVLIKVAVRDASPQRARDIADALGASLVEVVEDLERPDGAVASTVNLAIVTPAQLPRAPVAPDVPLQLAVGLLLGLGAGVAVATLRTVLDSSVRTPEDVERIALVPVTGLVGADRDSARRPLVVQDEEWSARAEAYRQLRTNVRYSSVDRALRSVVVSSALPGEGKTTTVANLAITMAQAGQSVIVVDADLRRPRLTSLLGLDPSVGLTNVLVDHVAVEEALQEWQDGLPLRVLASGAAPPNPSELLGSQRMQWLVQELAGKADVVLFDTPPLLPVTDAALLAPAADAVLVVSRSGQVGAAQLRQAVGSLRAVGANVLGVVLNGVPRGSSAYGGAAYSYDYRTEKEPTPRLSPVRQVGVWLATR